MESFNLRTSVKMRKINGMLLEFVSREFYSKKTEQIFKDYLQNKYGNHYLIPEGGNNLEGILGCTEIVQPQWDYDYILCTCGTATTYAGIISSVKNNIVVGISVLKGENKLPNDVSKILKEISPKVNFIINGDEELRNEMISSNCILSNYSFNGYANFYKTLIDFKIDFENKYTILLDYVYTNKLFFAAFDLMTKHKFKKNAKILILHSGGLQGNKGFEQRFKC